MQTSLRLCRPLPTAPMLESHLLQHPRHRFMAFSAVGVLMVCLPLWQVLQYQQSDLQQLANERALLNPVTRAVHVQFGLLAHQKVSAQLLQGQPELEPTRQTVQEGVDGELQALSQELKQGLWSHAAAETRDLSNDWQTLAQQVKARALTAARSDEAHALRVEQAVQVVDLVTMADPLTGAVPAEALTPSNGASNTNQRHANSSSPHFAELARRLSHLALELPMATPADATQTPSQGPSLSFELPRTQPQRAENVAEKTAPSARLLRQLQQVQRVLEATPTAMASVAGAAPTSLPRDQAWAELDRSTRQVLQLLQTAGATTASTEGRAGNSETLQRAVHRAHEAQLALFNQALEQHKHHLAQRHNTVQRQQVSLLAALALLAAAAMALAAALMRQLSTPHVPQNSPPPDSAAGPPQRALGATAWKAPASGSLPSATQVEAVRLMDRLRSARSVHNESPPGARPQSEDTLPPERS